MIITAKGIGGGLPLAAVTARAEIMDSSHVGGLGGTYGGNPIACAAALGVFETIERKNWSSALDTSVRFFMIRLLRWPRSIQ